jgi:DNA replication protein DnaC
MEQPSLNKKVTVEKKCSKCGRYYKREFCDYCKRESLWDRQAAIGKLPPRIQKVLTENSVKVDPGDLEYLHSGGSLLISGAHGTGKTVYGCAVLFESMRLCYVEQLTLGYHYFVKEPELLQNIRDSFGKEGKKFSMDFLYRDIVLIDDLGAEKVTDWVLDVLYRIVDYRYDYMLPTIFTTNLSGDQMADRLGDRIPHRLEEMCKKVYIKGKSKRRKL